MRRVDVRLLGAFEVSVDGRPVEDEAWQSRRAADVVKVLALSDGHRMSRERMVETLWPERSPEAGLANLHKAAHLARKAMGARDAVVLRGGEVRLALGARVRCDVERFEASTDPDVYGGELLPRDRLEEWTQAPRERLRRLYFDALRACGRLEELVEEEPADERAQRQLMRASVEAGDRRAGLRRYQELARALAGIGLRPSDETEALRRELARGPASTAPLTDASPLLGRDAELGRALEAWWRAGDGRGGAVLVCGEAGIGKTRLCEEVLDHAARDAWTTLRGGAAGEGSAPFAPISEAFDRLLLERPDLAVQLTDIARAELTRLSAASLDPPPASGAEPERQRIFSAAGQLVAAAAHERGAVLLLDDLHAADDATIALAHFLARAARFQRLLVVLSFRDAPASPALATLRAGLLDQRAAIELELAALRRPDAEELVRRVAGRPPRLEAIETVWKLARGHPFFTAELAAAIGAGGDVEVPGRLYEVLHARISRLEPPVLDALVQLAVVGESFSREEVAWLGQEALQAAQDGEVIVATEGGYRFRHALVREALVRRVPANRLANAHRAAAARLSATNAAPGRVAEHLLAAGEPAEAACWLSRAAGEAAAVAAWADALRYVDQALEADRERQAELLPVRADLLLATGDPGAPAAYGEALAGVEGPERLALRLKQARAFLHIGDIPAAIAALDGLAASDDVGRARLVLLRGMVAWFCGRTDAARAAGAQARELAIRAGLGRETAEATQLQAAVAHSDGSWSAHLQVDMSRTLGLPDLEATVFDAHLCISEYVLASGVPYERLVGAAADVLASAQRAGARRVSAFATTVLGEAEQLRGQLDAAEWHLRGAVELSRDVGATSAEALARLRLGEVALDGGREREGTALLEEALGLARFSPIADHLLYLVYAAMIRSAPDPESAVTMVDQAESSLEPHRSCFFCPIAFTVAATVACARAGQTKRARGFLAASEQRAGLWTAGSWPAAVREAAAEVAIADGDTRWAADLLEDAADRFARAGQPLNRARVTAALDAIAP